jgi:hypothetical protein
VNKALTIEENGAESLMALGGAAGADIRGLGFEEYCRIGLYEWHPG